RRGYFQRQADAGQQGFRALRPLHEDRRGGGFAHAGDLVRALVPAVPAGLPRTRLSTGLLQRPPDRGDRRHAGRAERAAAGGACRHAERALRVRRSDLGIVVGGPGIVDPHGAGARTHVEGQAAQHPRFVVGPGAGVPHGGGGATGGSLVFALGTTCFLLVIPDYSRHAPPSAFAFAILQTQSRSDIRDPVALHFNVKALGYSRHPWRSPFGPPSAFAFAVLQTQSGLRRNDEKLGDSRQPAEPKRSVVCPCTTPFGPKRCSSMMPPPSRSSAMIVVARVP